MKSLREMTIGSLLVHGVFLTGCWHIGVAIIRFFKTVLP